VQKIVVTHNGRVTVQPEPGGGTRFTVVLPLADDRGQNAEEGGRRMEGGYRKA
jgi:K+-sensing histidine kinase KdpD